MSQEGDVMLPKGIRILCIFLAFIILIFTGVFSITSLNRWTNSTSPTANSSANSASVVNPTVTVVRRSGEQGSTTAPPTVQAVRPEQQSSSKNAEDIMPDYVPAYERNKEWESYSLDIPLDGSMSKPIILSDIPHVPHGMGLLYDFRCKGDCRLIAYVWHGYSEDTMQKILLIPGAPLNLGVVIKLCIGIEPDANQEVAAKRAQGITSLPLFHYWWVKKKIDKGDMDSLIQVKD